MKIGKAKLDVSDDCITAVSTHACVISANDMLWIGVGVAVTIRKNGGDVIEQEALANAPAQLGDAVVTGAGDLTAKWIIHAVVSGQDLVMTEETLRTAIKSVFTCVDDLKCPSLAFPMLTSEHSQVEIHVAARILVE